MTTDVLILGLLYMLTVFDNVILSAVFLPNGENSKDIALFAGCALPLAQVLLMLWAEQILKLQVVLLLASALMAWASIQTFVAVSWNRRMSPVWRSALRVILYTLVGNMDDVFWVGGKLHGNYLWLVFFAVATIPVYLLMTVSLAEACQRYRWILVGEAALTAWAGSEMFFQAMLNGQLFRVASQAQMTGQILLTLLIISIGFVCLTMHQRRVG